VENIIERAARDLLNSKYAIALTGAGMSTESGIPDFRGPDGLWTKHPELESQAYRMYDEFKVNPKAYWVERLNPEGWIWSFFEGLKGGMRPNPGHYALAELEQMGILKCVITQNVDELHQEAGNRNVIEYHGGLSKFRCDSCGRRFHSNEIDLERLKKEDKLPPYCNCGGVIKDDGVFFGEPIPSDVLQSSQQEAGRCDLMLICGTSAVVYPFASLPEFARTRRSETRTTRDSDLYANQDVPSMVIVEVNAEPTPLTRRGISDYIIQGKTGDMLPRIVDAAKRFRRL
jgi:NAD-dependent deacetylase